MNELLNFREIRNVEEEIIFQSLSKLSSKIVQFLKTSQKNLYISFKQLNIKSNYPCIYLDSNQFRKKLDLIELRNKISSIGLFFGFIKKGKFYLSLEGAEFLYHRGKFSEIKRVYVNKNGEKAILYGNNILKNMLSKKSFSFEEKDFLLIFNENDEILAIAQAKIEKKSIEYLKPKDVIALNLSDKGIYLREKQ
ncbi:MAG: PUA domain-containing protein [Promethearchaeota archaeon]